MIEHRRLWRFERDLAVGQDAETRRRVLAIQLVQMQECERRPRRVLAHIMLAALGLLVLAVCGGALR